jgi:GGDEF domain-containing protein
MSEGTTLPRSHLSGQDAARGAEKDHERLRDESPRSPTALAVAERDNLLDEVLELTSRLEEARQTISRLEEVIVSLQERCTMDPLTGVHNRRGGEERLAEDVARASRGGGTLTLVVLDADNLKEANDRWGLHAGDAYLKHLANVIERHVREGDWIAEDLQRNPLRLARGEEARVGFSAGVCKHRGDGESARELFSRADAALLEAKKEGRGTIVEAP